MGAANGLGQALRMNADRLFCDTVLAERIERLEAQLVAKGSEAARRRRGDTVGFVMPIAGGVASFWSARDVVAAAMRDLTAAAGITRYIALHDGVIAGGASFRMAGNIAQLTGAATAPAHRRRGIQSALLSARLADAAAAGCDVAVTSTKSSTRAPTSTPSSAEWRGTEDR